MSYYPVPAALLDNMQSVKELNHQRSALKKKLTAFSTFVDSFENQNRDQVNKDELNFRLKSAPKLLHQFNDIETKLEGLLPESSNDEQQNERKYFEKRLNLVLAKAKCMLEKYSVPSDSLDNSQKIKLRKIDVPTFDGSYKQWIMFKDPYITLIHASNTLTNIKKFHYLKSLLKGSAESTISSLELTSHNYPIAWELVMIRYNERFFVQECLKALYSMEKIFIVSPELLRKFAETVQENLHSLKLLGEPIQHWDTMIIYMVVTKLDENTCLNWENYRSNLSKVKVKDLLHFLRDSANILDQTLGQTVPIYYVPVTENKN